MAIDTSIYGLAGKVKSVGDYDREALLADEARQQQQLTAMQIMTGQQKQQEYMRGVQRADALRQLAGRWKADTTDEQRIVDLKNAGFAQEADTAEKAFLERQKAGAEVASKKAATTKAELDNQITRMGTILNVISGAKDQGSYSQGRAVLAQAGFDVSQVPEQFDPAYVSAAGQQALTALQRMQEERDRLAAEETVRHNKAGEKTAAGQLAVSQGNLTVSQQRLAFEKQKDNLDRTQPKPKAAGPMSVTLQKELIDSDDAVAANASIKDTLSKALALNDKAYSGVAAKGRAVVRSNLPFESEGANATIDLDNMMTGQALESLKAIFGGMPTEGERKILLDMQASADKTPAQRKSIIERAMAAADRRGAMAKAKAKAIREGTYLTEGAQLEPIAADTGGGPKPIKDNAEYDALPSGAEFIDPKGQKRRKP